MYACHCPIRFSRIILVEEWFPMQVNAIKRFMAYEESNGKRNPDRSIR